MTSRKKSQISLPTKSELKEIIGFTVKKLPLYQAALTHPSFRNENYALTKGLENFDRLEFLGDSILNEIVCQELFKRFPDADEGMLSKLRSIIVSQKILSRIAQSIKLQKIFRIGKNLKQCFKTFLKTKILTDSMEALFAAIYFDCGKKKISVFILKHFEPYFEPKLLFRLDPNPKSTLQELSLKRWQKLPIYSHQYSAKGVKTTVCVGGKKKAFAIHKIKKESEILAARALVSKLKKEDKKVKKRNKISAKR